MRHNGSRTRNDTSRSLKGLNRVRSWALTGTSIESHEEELASILEFVDHDQDGQSKRYQPGPELFSRHRQLQLRRKKGDVLEDLPEKQVTLLPIGLHATQRASYNKAEQEGVVYLRSLGRDITIQHVLELITRLKQICNADPENGESSKLDDIRERLELLADQEHKALVFSQYTSDTAGVATAASYLRDFNPLVITGDVPLPDRPAIIERLKNKVNVIKYSCTDTIEDRIDAILARKQDLFDRLVDDVSMDLSSRLSREELFGLFGLERYA